MNADVLEDKPGFVPLPKKQKLDPGIMPLTEDSRIVVIEHFLLPLAEVLSGEIEQVTGLDLKCAVAKGNDGDIIIEIDRNLKGESYSLVIAAHAVVRGGNYQAAAMGTATLLQSIVLNGTGAAGLARMSVDDAPDTAYRGLLVDVARQWHSPETVKQIIRLCRLYKIRYLQLHLTDDQAFTVPLKRFPKIPTKGRSYTFEQIKDLVSYADRRAVTLIPEIDMPAHSSAICRAMPDLFKSPNGGIINFASDEAVDAMGEIIDEVCILFASSPYIHLGADEANLHGLDRDPQFQAAIKKYGTGSVGGLFNHFLNRIDRRVKEHGKTSIAWEGFHLGNGPAELDKSFIVMPFDNYKNAERYYIKGGHKVINTSWYPLYVVGQRPLTRFVYDWDLYTFGNYTDPFPRRTSSVRQYRVTVTSKVLGAQMCSWEQRQETEMEQLRHPLPAMSERLWSRTTEDYNDFRRRLARTDQLLNALLTTKLPSTVDATASKSVYADGVMIRWRAADNYATRYTLLRSTTDDLASAGEIAADIAELEFFDRKAEKGKTYYYWVKAGNRLGCSEPGGSASGSAGVASRITHAYESFDYAAGKPLNGCNGGRGWESAWSLKSGGPAVIKKQGLTYKGLPTSGGCVNVKLSMKTPGAKSLHILRTTEIPMGEPGVDFWMSFLMRANKLGEGHCFLNSVGKAWVNGLQVAHGKKSGHPLKEGETTFLVVHYACMNGRDICRMWVNPSLKEKPPFDVHDMAYCDSIDIGVRKTVLLNVQPHGGGDYDFDEIRIGRTWEEVTGGK